jgi:hypothetical protein
MEFTLISTKAYTMSRRLHPITRKYLSELLSDTPEAMAKRSTIGELVREELFYDADNFYAFLRQLNTLLGSNLNPVTDHQRQLPLEKEVENTEFHANIGDFREILKEQFNLSFPNTFQLCAFLLLIKLPDQDPENNVLDYNPEDDPETLLTWLNPDPLFFETTDSYDYDGDPINDWNDPLTTKLVVNWCPHSLLTDPEMLVELICQDNRKGFHPFEETYLYELYRYFTDLRFEELPEQLRKDPGFGITEWIKLLQFPYLQPWVHAQLVEYLLQLKKSEYHVKEAIPVIPAETPRYEEMIRHLLSLDGLLLKKFDNTFQDREDLVAIAIENHGTALSYASERLQHNPELIEKAIRNTPLSICSLPEPVKQNLHWVSLATDLLPEVLAGLPLDAFDEATQLTIWQKAISASPIVIQLLPEPLRKKYPELFRLALEKDARTVVFALPDDAVSEEQLAGILSNHPLLFRHLPEDARSNPRLLSIAIQKEPLVYKHVPKTHKSRAELVNAALDANLLSIQEIHPHAVPDARYIRTIIETNPFLIPARFITLHYANEEGLCEQYLQATLGGKNRDLMAIEAEDDAFQEREEALQWSLFITPATLNDKCELPF